MTIWWVKKVDRESSPQLAAPQISSAAANHEQLPSVSTAECWHTQTVAPAPLWDPCSRRDCSGKIFIILWVATGANTASKDNQICLIKVRVPEIIHITYSAKAFLSKVAKHCQRYFLLHCFSPETIRHSLCGLIRRWHTWRHGASPEGKTHREPGGSATLSSISSNRGSRTQRHQNWKHSSWFFALAAKPKHFSNLVPLGRTVNLQVRPPWSKGRLSTYCGLQTQCKVQLLRWPAIA